jgi:hypothetical protein
MPSLFCSFFILLFLLLIIKQKQTQKQIQLHGTPARTTTEVVDISGLTDDQLVERTPHLACLCVCLVRCDLPIWRCGRGGCAAHFICGSVCTAATRHAGPEEESTAGLGSPSGPRGRYDLSVVCRSPHSPWRLPTTPTNALTQHLPRGMCAAREMQRGRLLNILTPPTPKSNHASASCPTKP